MINIIDKNRVYELFCLLLKEINPVLMCIKEKLGEEKGISFVNAYCPTCDKRGGG